jgi:hypothetical protein
MWSLTLYTRTKCRNPNLGIATKARACKGASQNWSSRVTFHAPEGLRVWDSVRIEPPHFQMNSHFGSWSPNGVSNLHRTIAGVKNHWIEEFLYHWKTLGMQMPKMSLHDPFGHMKHKIYPKKGSGVILPNLTLDH